MATKNLEDYLTHYGSPTSSCVRQIIDLGRDIAIGVDPNKVHIVNPRGRRSSEIEVSFPFTRDIHGNIVHLRYHHKHSPNQEVIEFNTANGRKTSRGEFDMCGSLTGLVSNGAFGGKRIFTASYKSDTVVAAFLRYEISTSRLWQRQIKGDSPRAMFCVDNQNIYVSTYIHPKLYVYYQSKGQLVKKYDMSEFGVVDALDVQGDMLAIGSKHGAAVGVMRDDKILWGECIGQTMAVEIVGNTLLAGTECFGGRLYAFKLSTGKPLWEMKMPENRGIWSMLRKGNLLYLGTGIGGEGDLYALDLKKLL